MKCPKCGSNELRIAVKFSGNIACSFRSEESFDFVEPVKIESDWDDSSRCHCIHCHWKGIVGDTKPRPSRHVCLHATSPEKIASIKQKLAKCPEPWKKYLGYVLGEVDRLDQIVEMLTRTSSQLDNGDGSDDTVIR